jgi:phi13 family phage major tail protein
MNNKVEFGISRLTFWELVEDGTDSAAPKYSGEPFSVPGTVKMSVSNDSSTSDFYADNGKYYSGSSNAGNSGDFETALLPDDFKAAAFGWRIDERGGLVETKGGKRKHFAMAYQIEGDDHNRRVVHYDVTLSVPDEDHNTSGESIDPDTITVSWSGKHQNLSGEDATRYSLSDSTDQTATYSAWFAAPVVPATAKAEG